MGLSLKDLETERRVRQLAQRKQLGITATIRLAVDHELARVEMASDDSSAVRWDRIEAIQTQSKRLPVLDRRSDDEILGYGADGISE